MHLKEGEQHVDDVSSALKRFLRDLPDGLFTRAQRLAWLEASGGPCSPWPALSILCQDFPSPRSTFGLDMPLPTALAPLPPLLFSPLVAVYRARVPRRQRAPYLCACPALTWRVQGMQSPSMRGRTARRVGWGGGDTFLICFIFPRPPEIEDEEKKVSRYRELLVHLPPVNRATVKALISHLYW